MVHLLLLLTFPHPAQGTLQTLVPHVHVPALHVRLGLCSPGKLEVCSEVNICAYRSDSI